MNAAEQIRAEYIETLARAQRAADLRHYPQRGDGTPREDWEVMPDWRCRQYLDSVVPYVDALAEAGLLPTGVRWSIAWRQVPERAAGVRRPDQADATPTAHRHKRGAE